MIGPGTGLAPFRGFIQVRMNLSGKILRYDFQERAWQKEQGKTVGPTVLFFGCRNKEQDYIYRLDFHLRINLLITFSHSGRSWRLGNRRVCSPFTPHSAETRFVSVFTRHQFLASPCPPLSLSLCQAEKRYVTHDLREQGSEVWKLLDQGAHLYVCGDAKMMAKV